MDCEVLKLLHDMKAELEQDAENDQSVYDKLASTSGIIRGSSS